MTSSGSTSEQSRVYNERIILQLARQNPGISRVSIAEKTGLSAQTISVITSSLLEQQLLHVTGKVKGRRGQPSIQLSINAIGAYGLGINVDRDHISAVLLDFSGVCVLSLERAVSFPTEGVAQEIAQDLIDEVKTTLAEDWGKVQGIGLSRPDYMDSWLESLVTDEEQKLELETLKNALLYWQSDAFELWLAEQTGLPCYCQNDAVAAVISELLLVSDAPKNHLFYLFVSTACGGSLIADGECYFGAHGRAGSFGLIPTATGKHGKWILEALSVSSLRRFLAMKQVTWPLVDGEWLNTSYRPLVAQWVEEVALEIQPALSSVVALYDPEAILIGGRLPEGVLWPLIESIKKTQQSHSLLPFPAIRAAQTGYTAGALGAAVLPLYQTFAPQRNLLLLHSRDKSKGK
ncbi:ROK family transcriptional regulator [Marinomonas transparens]|uniref:ROK family transcriptional regulator n=1 Tax=Marinomonas transparens TaxID=2795388 RepID=A0A934JS15_9GAMM|nr:ROK family transcriptional regulator [Marinomonas transparens]MBJ7538818.1 ROK family transcriptional regulator [Marinomonas transparens]